MRVVHVIKRESRAGHITVSTADGLEQFELEVDQALRDALGPSGTATTAAPQPVGEPTITPREIQVRVRAGEDPAVVAAEHNATTDWVMRFAGPVLAERARIADEARRAKARRTNGDGQTVIFGEAVDSRFSAHGIDPGTVRWDTVRRDDGQWVVTARWLGGDSEHDAQWVCHLTSRVVTPLDDTAADLLSDRPIRPVVPPAPETAEQVRSLTLAPPLAPGLVAFPAMPDAHTGPLPRAREEVFDQSRYPDAFADEPALPLNLPPAAPREPRRESEDEKAARASIPSWDDILLGVRRKSD